MEEVKIKKIFELIVFNLVIYLIILFIGAKTINETLCDYYLKKKKYFSAFLIRPIYIIKYLIRGKK